MVVIFLAYFTLYNGLEFHPCLQSPYAVILEPLPPKINKVCHCFPCFPIYFPEVMGPDAMILVFWMLSFKSIFFFTFLFPFPQRIYSSSFSVIWVVPWAYLRLLIFLPAILIPACASSSPVFLMMYSAYKQGDIYSLDILLSWFGTSLFFHDHFWLLLPELHTDFSGGRSDGLVLPCLAEFSTVCGDPHRQRLWHSK